MNVADTAWYKCEIDRKIIKGLSRRTNWHGLVYLGVFIFCVACSGWIAIQTIGTWWVVPAFLVYGSIWIFATSIVHEACHGTPFRSRGLNETVLFVFGMLVQQSPCVLRYTHARHHSQTTVTGKDPEIVLKNPMTWSELYFKQFLDAKSIGYYFKTTVMMSLGKPDQDIRDCVPESELPKAVLEARIYLFVYACIVTWSLLIHSWLPVVMLLLPRLFGGPMHGLVLATQHIGLAQNIRDYRLSTRTMYVNPLFGILYWNMNYHIEHHMFPNVPFHSLPSLHDEIKDQCPVPTRGIFGALTEILATVKLQHTDPAYSPPRSTES